MVSLIYQTCYLLDQQIRQQEQDFLEHGGMRERMTRARIQVRATQEPEPAVSGVPVCPVCGQPMRERMARTGTHAGQPFWGCSAYPACRGVRNKEQ